jgi:predicted CoA-binding protein
MNGGVGVVADPILDLLLSTRTVAVVGCSDRPDRDSHRVAAYLQASGYRVVPVNPGQSAILGERCYPDLGAIPPEVEVDLVDVFRRPEVVPGVVEQTIARGVRVVWLQLGVGHPEAEARGRAAGLVVVSERCLKVEHAARRAALEGRA